jgi:hypothetical protein
MTTHNSCSCFHLPHLFQLSLAVATIHLHFQKFSIVGCHNSQLDEQICCVATKYTMIFGSRRSKFLCVTFVWLLKTLALAYSPEVSHRHIAGLWKLTPTTSTTTTNPLPKYPIKEFTVYPKDKDKQRITRNDADTSNIINSNKKPSILLMLKENGQFEQYPEDTSMSAEQQGQTLIPEKLHYHRTADILDRYSSFGWLKGNWELIDGKLILAPDRPTNDFIHDKKSQDAVLEGEVVAFSEQGLSDNPALVKNNHRDDNANDLPTSTESKCNNGRVVLDTHLSVPKGRINVGRFMYPKHHPYFFVTPIYNPLIKGKFELKQVLGSLNTQQRDENEEATHPELFREKDFYGKKFWLTSHPLSSHQPKGKMRWSIKYNKYVGMCTEPAFEMVIPRSC